MLGGFDGGRLSLREAHRFPNDPVMLGDAFHWDVLRLFHEMKRGIIKGVRECGDSIKGIGIDTWGVDFGLLDASGALLGNPFHYRDARSDGMMGRASEMVPLREIYMTTGIQFLKFNTVFQLLSMTESRSPTLEKARTLLFMPDLLEYFLTGEKKCEMTVASTSQMHDPVAGGWARGMLGRLGIRDDILLEPIPSGTIGSGISKALQGELMCGGIPVISVASHDTGSAVVSVPAKPSSSCAYLSSGTWSLLGTELESPIINDESYARNFTNEGGFGGRIRFLKNIMGLWIYQECKRVWEKGGGTETFDELEDAAASSPAFGAAIDPDDDLFSAPGDMPGRIASYCRATSQRPPETKPETVRCVMESLALKYRHVLESLEALMGRRLDTIHIVGGGCRNVLLNAMTADATGRTVVAGPSEATSIGNLVAQLIALGEVGGLEQGRALIADSFKLDVYEPREPGVWDERYGWYKETILKG